MSTVQRDRIPRAVLLDCLGTLLALEPPAPRLAAALGVPLAEAERAVRAEIAYYRAHMHAADDAARLARLRARCAGVVSEVLGVPCDVDTLLASLVFTPFDEVIDVLGRLRALGVRLVVVSNWDVSLHDVLERTGIGPLVDGAVSSAEVGAAKPDPAPVRAALALARVAPRDAVLAGDSPEDAAAAAAAGVRALRIDRPRVTLRALLSQPG
jgi:putative hydrolase of the HAD superfamily